jgi:glucokinase
VDTENFDALTRIASRRGSLLALGGAGLAALTGAVGAAAKPKPGKLARKKVKEKCKAQVGQCEAALSSFCEPSEVPEGCKLALLPCCASLSTCNAGATAQCVAEAFSV